MKKLVTGTQARTEEHPIVAQYKGKLSEEILSKCLEFSALYFSSLQGLDNLSEKKSALKHKAEEVKALITTNNKEVFLSYLEDLILRNSNHEFLIPYYMCKESSDSIEPEITALHDRCYLDLWGKVDDVLAA